MPTYGQIQGGQIWLGSAGWQPIPKGTIGNPSTKPSTVKASTAPVVQGNVIMPSAQPVQPTVAYTGGYTPQVVQSAQAPR